ncbi:MAG: phosphatase PAP2 family protein [Chloroflexi bacterium]|nr:phosphatase PAP2 family protein [Chloroflexota bacterium]
MHHTKDPESGPAAQRLDQARPGRRDHPALWERGVAREIVIAVAAFVLYFGVRGFTESLVDRARQNADYLIRFERWLGLYHERRLQDLIADNDQLITLMNWVYIWGHWPVIAGVASWLVWKQHDHYLLIRDAFLISGAIGLAIFAVFPVAPPRLMDIDLIDTVTERSHAYRVLQPPFFVNQYAAMPSLHLGWDLLVGIALFRFAEWRFFRIAGLVLPVFMAIAIVATANHYIIDGVAGVIIALAALIAASYLRRWQQPRAVADELPYRALHPPPRGVR